MRNGNCHSVLKDFFAVVEDWVQRSLFEDPLVLLLGVVS